MERFPPNRGDRKRSSNALFQALLIAAVAAVVTLVYQSQGTREVHLDDANVYVSITEIDEFPNALWVDARTLDEFETKRVAGSILLNEENWEGLLFPLLEQWDPNHPILVYCGRSACLRSLDVAKRLRSELGVESVYAIEGGWHRIVEAGVSLE